ncbi:tetratricopeptide repeat protein [uncultured Desulfobacter sp.]|uniref:tetratricopeptide repeat protein n=1 Tax=uncultured Desulfobacter sp. TaxID=240139 RepID=UPI0029F45D93|nr:tetratricopeptide repeat protein [uncultured Desulfobacter sp.]
MTILDNSKTKSTGNADQLIEQGLNHHKKGDLSNAGRYYSQAVHMAPGNASAYLFLGILANEAEKPKLAVSMIEQAISLSPKFAAAYHNMGVALAKLGHEDEAAKNFERALSLDPDAADYLSKMFEKKSGASKYKKVDDLPAPSPQKIKKLPPIDPGKNHPPNDRIQRVIKLYQAGNMIQAEQTCKKQLNDFPDSFMLLNLLGAVVQAQGRVEEAIEAFDRMLHLNPDFAEGYYNRGVAFSQIGRTQEAVQDYTMAVELTPNFYNAHLNLGLVFAARGDFNQAVQSFNRAIDINPDNALGYNNRAFSLMNAGKLDAGLQDCEKAIVLDSNLPEIHNIRGLIFDKLGKAKKAVNSFKIALQLKPGSVQFQVNLAKSLNELNNYEQALKYCNQALESHPNSPDAHFNRGIALQGLMRFEDAIDSYDRTIELAPKFSDAFCNRGICFHQLERIEKGFADLNKAIELNPYNVNALSNRGLSHRHFGQFEAARKDFQQALSIKPDDGPTLFNRALLYLLTGDFERGWSEYERRWEKSQRRHFSNAKIWNSESLSGKIIFIYGEQGFGDFIQFVRYLPLLQKMGARVILECKTALARLMINFNGYDRLQIQTNDNAKPIKERFDYHLPIMSLPRLFKTTLDTIPSQVSYLTADTELTRIWKNRIKKGNALDVGIVWAGNPSHKGDRRRSISLSRFAPLKEITEVNLYSLQKEPHELWTDPSPENFFSFDFGEEISDFADTAAIITNLDLIISVDTSVAHLAGALGKETWVLLPFSPDWRWLTNRNDSPWYPAMKLFRQPALGDWDNVLKNVTAALKQKIAQKK